VIQTCLTVKVLFGLPLRQTTGFVASLLKRAGLDWPVPDYSTLRRRQRTLAVQLPYRGSGAPPHLLVDGTGIEVRGEGEWHARKHGGARRRVWRKVHLAIDEGEEDRKTVRGTVVPTNREVRALEVTDSGVGDAPMPSGLPSRIPADEPISSVTADGAQDGRACRDAIVPRGAEAILPPRERRQAVQEGRPGRPGPQRSPARHEALRPDALAELVRPPPTKPRRDQDELHEASRSETRRPRLRPTDRRDPRPHRLTALGIPVTQPVSRRQTGKGEVRPSAASCGRAVSPQN
jgi:hypothetical protein